MYYLGSFGTYSMSKVITVQERMKALNKKKEDDKIIEENKEEEDEKINEEKEEKKEEIKEEKKEEKKEEIKEDKKEDQLQDIKRGHAKYISSKYILKLFIFR